MSKLRIAILGCGGFATHHAQQMRKHPDVQVVALCDLNDDIVNSFLDFCLKDYEPRPALFTDRVAMYEQARPDAVVIVTPHTFHYQHAVEALEYGCHILVEKPMVTSSRDARDLAGRVEKAGKILTIGYGTPCTPEFRFLRQLIRDKTLGNLELVNAWLTQNWMDATRGKWRQEPELSGGGQAYDSGAHLLNSVCWAVEDQVAEVYAMIDNHGTRVDVNSAINVRFTKGVRASILIGGNCPTAASQMMLAFDGGHVNVDGWNGGWIKVHTREGELKYPHIDFPDQTPDINFVDAVLGRAEPLTGPINGLIQSELMDAIYESARIGQPVQPQR